MVVTYMCIALLDISLIIASMACNASNVYNGCHSNNCYNCHAVCYCHNGSHGYNGSDDPNA